ncbi:hypothetical protein [uncultured Apibacter sp.]
MKLFGAFLLIRNILTIFDQFKGNEKLKERNLKNY